MAYSSGNLPEAFSLAVATHISMCDQCRAALESFDAVGGALLENSAEVAVQTDALAKTMALIKADTQQRNAAQSEEARRGTRGDVPAPLAEYIGTSFEDVQWKPIGMGVKQSILETAGGATARLLFIPPGTAVPDHSHSGTELTLVLQGAFADDDDYFAAGDIEIADGDVKQAPVAANDMPCICLAVTEAPLKFSKFFHKAVQPFLNI